MSWWTQDALLQRSSSYAKRRPAPQTGYG